MERGLMLNDGDCGFCMRTAALVPRLGVDIDASTIQAVDLDALGVDPARAEVEMPYVHPDGRVDYGHRAFAAILRTGPLPWRLVGRLMTTRPVDPVARRAYHWIAANRSRLPGGTPSCALPPVVEEGRSPVTRPAHPGGRGGTKSRHETRVS